MRHSSDQKLAALRRVEGLDRCPTSELRAASRVVDFVEVVAGSLLATEMRPARRAWIVVDGTVEVTSRGDRLWLAGPGTLVGDLGLLGPVPMATSVASVTAVQALEFDPRALDRLLGQPGVCRWICSQFDRQVRTLLGAPLTYERETVTPLS